MVIHNNNNMKVFKTNTLEQVQDIETGAYNSLYLMFWYGHFRQASLNIPTNVHALQNTERWSSELLQTDPRFSNIQIREPPSLIITVKIQEFVKQV